MAARGAKLARSLLLASAYGTCPAAPLRSSLPAALGRSGLLTPSYALRHAAAPAQRPLDGLRWLSSQNGVPELRTWTFEDVKKEITSPQDHSVVIVDVREPEELLETGKIPGAINIPMTAAPSAYAGSEEDFENTLGFERPDKSSTLMFYCRAGVRARAAADIAQGAGWDDIIVYPGSWLDWAEHGGPVERVSGKS